MRVSFVAAECEPWAKTGGLADVVDALARALGRLTTANGSALRRPVDVYLPLYRGIIVPPAAVLGTTTIAVGDPRLPDAVNRVDLVDVAGDGYRLRLVDHPAAFDRDGYYGDADGDFPDNAWRFGLLCRAAFEAIRRDGGTDILHLHDWHTGPALLLRDGPYAGDAALGPAASLLTIHNLAYRGWVPPDRTWLLGLDVSPERPPGAAAPRDPRFTGRVAAPLFDTGIDLLRAGIERAELVNTVSPTFAAESLRPESGMGLDDLLAERGDAFFGILNGIDTALWDPATDPDLAAPFDRDHLQGKAVCRRDLLARLGFDPEDDGPVLGAIGRLDPQKGFDLLVGAAPALLARGARIVVQGSGDPVVAETLRALAAAEPRRIAFVERFDRAMARRIYAGADLFVMPSRFEPSGQGQMIALRYGTPPVVRATGGLVDSVVDVADDPARGVGFRFGPAEVPALVEACERAMLLRGDGRTAGWSALVRRGMACDFSWESGSAPRYLQAYERALRLRTSAAPVSSAAQQRKAAPAGNGRERREDRMSRQFVVQLPNKPGGLADLSETLAARGVDLRAIGGGGIGDSGHLILTTADDATTRAILDEGGYTYIEGESILAEVDDRPGGMARIARALADAGVNIHGHLFLGRWGDRAMFTFVVDRPDVARPILERKG